MHYTRSLHTSIKDHAYMYYILSGTTFLQVAYSLLLGVQSYFQGYDIMCLFKFSILLLFFQPSGSLGCSAENVGHLFLRIEK